jgi:integrase
MALTDTAIRLARPRERAYKLSDGRGLCLLVQPNGSKWWRYRYRFEGVPKMLSMGIYPDVPLSEARERRDAARRQLAIGVNPSAQRKIEKAAAEHTFESVGRHWLAQQARYVHKKKRALTTYQKAKWMLQSFIFPDLGSRPIGSITAPELLVVLKKIETQGLNETARRTKQRCSQVFRHGIGLGNAERDITLDLRGLLEPPIVTHLASITDPVAVGALLRAIDGYTGRRTTVCALKLAPLLFVRPGELRSAEWMHVDLGNAQWRIPAAMMKMDVQHLVPLSRQALAILRELKGFTGNGRYLFPGLGKPHRTMSENTINDALRTLGYARDDMTGHGFRSMASTLLNEQGCWTADAIERQLAHGEGNHVRAAYNSAEYLPERRRMMQAWADYLDELRLKKNQGGQNDSEDVPQKRAA